MAVPNSAIRAGAGLASSALMPEAANSFTAQISSLQHGLISDYYQNIMNRLEPIARKQAISDWYSSHDDAYTKANQGEFNRFVSSVTNSYINGGIPSASDPNKFDMQPISYYMNNPIERTKAINQTHQEAMAIFAGRSALSFFSPLSLQTTQVNPQLMSLINKTMGATNYKAQDALYREHPEAVFYATHSSASQTGLPLQATLDMGNFQNRNADLFQSGKYDQGLAAFVPYTHKGNAFDSSEYHAQLAAGVRNQLGPEDFVKAMATGVGNNYIYNTLPWITQNVMGGDNTAEKYYKSIYAMSNPLWSQNLGKSKPYREQAYQQVKQLLATPGIDKRLGFKDTVPLVREIMGKYNEFNQEATNSSGWGTYLQDQWTQYLTDFAKQHPMATNSVYSVFMGLKVNDKHNQ